MKYKWIPSNDTGINSECIGEKNKKGQLLVYIIFYNCQEKIRIYNNFIGKKFGHAEIYPQMIFLFNNLNYIY